MNSNNNNTMLAQFHMDNLWHRAWKNVSVWEKLYDKLMDDELWNYHRAFYAMECISEQVDVLLAKQSCEATITWRNDVPERRVQKAYRRINNIKDELEYLDYKIEKEINIIEWFENKEQELQDRIKECYAIIAAL